MTERKIATIDFNGDGGYIATFPDRDPETDKYVSCLAKYCIELGYNVKYKLMGE